MPSSNSTEPEAGLVQPSTQPADGVPTGPGVAIGVGVGDGLAIGPAVAVCSGDREGSVGRIVTLGTGVGLGVVMATGSA